MRDEILFFNDVQIAEDFVVEDVYTDVITGFKNQLALTDKIQTYTSNSSELTVLLFDIYNFRKINNFYGHDIGDEVLKYFSDKIKANFDAEKCEFFRTEPDKFYVLIDRTLDQESMIRYNNLLVSSLSDGCLLNDGQKLTISCTYGGARLNEETCVSKELLKIVVINNSINKEINEIDEIY